MVLHQESPVSAALPRGIRPGLALATALFGLVVVGLLTASAWTLVGINNSMSSNREDAARAQLVAEAGLNHALGLMRGPLRDTSMTRLLRGFDNDKTTTADNGLFVGYGLASAIQIPATGRAITDGTYYVTMVDDPGEFDNDPFTDRNAKILVRCRGVTPDGSEARINAVVGNNSVPGVAINGNFETSGTTNITGRCGGVHTNGNYKNGGTTTAETGACASGSWSDNQVKNVYGETLPKCTSAEPFVVPDLVHAELCPRADYHLTGSSAINLLTGSIVTLASLGWSKSGTIWEPSPSVTPGTYCVDGNVKISSDIGTAANPRPFSLIVKGSMEISGNPYFIPADPDGIMFIMQGDLKLNGNSTTTQDSFNGLVYAGSQCEFSGTVTMTGQLICANKPNPTGAEAWVAENKMSGTTTIKYGCGGFLGEVWRVLAWYPVFG